MYGILKMVVYCKLKCLLDILSCIAINPRIPKRGWEINKSVCLSHRYAPKLISALAHKKDANEITCFSLKAHLYGSYPAVLIWCFSSQLEF